MPRKIPYDFTAQAAEDLREIGRYTRKTWGLKQAQHYREEIKLALENLALNPKMGRNREDIAPQVRSFPLAKHIAYYSPRKDNGISILRLLHTSMDVETAFDFTKEKVDSQNRVIDQRNVKA